MANKVNFAFNIIRNKCIMLEKYVKLLSNNFETDIYVISFIWPSIFPWSIN